MTITTKYELFNHDLHFIFCFFMSAAYLLLKVMFIVCSLHTLCAEG